MTDTLDSNNSAPPQTAVQAHYEVGYKKPPRATRFKKGRSGNPKGRPKGRDRLGDVIIDALHEPVRINTADGPKTLSKIEAVIASLTNKTFSGDKRACRRLFKLCALAGNLKPTKQPDRGGGVLIWPPRE
jgi:hypothetical protein